MELKKIEFTDDLLLGESDIDSQHKTIVVYYNDYIEFINANGTQSEASRKEMHKLLNKLMEYTKYHFALEEKFMHKFDFSFVEEHKADHLNLLEHLTEYCVGACMGDITAYELADFFKKWIIGHIREKDLFFIQQYKLAIQE